MNPVVHFEMQYGDPERVSKFYSSAFGWKMQGLGEKMGDYILAETDETDDKGMLKETNRINGGFFPREASPDTLEPSVVIAVEKLEDAIGRVKDAGGKILGEPMEIPGIGMFVLIRDTEGNRVGMLEPFDPAQGKSGEET